MIKAAMTTTPFQREWVHISQRLGLSIELSYEVDLGHRKITVPVLLQGYGADKGMLLVTDYSHFADVADELVSLGYGFSCLSEPSPEPIHWGSIMEMLQDWGATPNG